MKPRPMPISGRPSGSSGDSQIDGTVIMNLSSQWPTSTSPAKKPTIAGTFFGGRVSRPKNGSAKTNSTTVAAILPNGSSNRLMKNGCSQGRSPYQITMYCDQLMYIQKIEKA